MRTARRTSSRIAAAMVTAAIGGCESRPDAVPPTSADAAADNLAILPLHLELHVAVDYEAERLDGTATWTIENTGADTLREVPVQLGRLMRATAVRSGDRALPHDQDVVVYEDWPEFQVNQLRVRLAEPLAPGRRTDITVAYGGPLVPYAETGMLYVKDHIDRGFTILRAESLAFPQIRVPSYETWRSMPRGDFTYGLRVTAPADLVVATGSPETSRTEAEGLATWTFYSPAPVPFLLAAIAPYETLVEGGLRVYHFAQDSAGARDLLTAMTETLRTYGDWFGPVGSAMRLHVIEIPEGWGSQAHLAAGIFQTAGAFRARSELQQLYHELAHLWHPADTDSVPPRWNEGLATFLQCRMAAARGESGPLAEVFAGLGARHVERFDGVASGPEGGPAMLDYGRAGVTDLSYGTGALMFYALYRTLGERAFDRALAHWFREHRAAGSTSAQFMRAIEEASGRDLGQLFGDWLTTTRWRERLAAGEGLEEMIVRYAAAAPPAR